MSIVNVLDTIIFIIRRFCFLLTRKSEPFTQKGGNKFVSYMNLEADVNLVFCLMDLREAERFINPNQRGELFPIAVERSDGSKFALCVIWLVSYKDTTCGRYTEFVLSIAVSHSKMRITGDDPASVLVILNDDRVMFYTRELFLNNQVAVEFGRSVHGFPKHLAHLQHVVEDGVLLHRVNQRTGGETLVECSVTGVVSTVGTAWRTVKQAVRALGWWKTVRMIALPIKVKTITPACTESGGEPGEVLTPGDLVCGLPIFHTWRSSDHLVLSRKSKHWVGALARTGFRPFFAVRMRAAFDLKPADPRCLDPKV